MSVLPIAQINIGERSRKDLGDVEGLAASIRELGLLNPVVIDSHRNLIAGRRRLAAAQSLGMTDIPVTVIENLDDARLALLAERDENTCRKEMTPEELFDLAEQIRAAVEADAKKRQAEGQEQGRESRWAGLSSMDDKPEKAPAWRRRTSTKLAETVGMSDATYRRTQQVVNAARGVPKKGEESVPEHVQAEAAEALADLNASKITPTGAARRVTNARKKAAAEPDPEPGKPKAPTKYGARRKHSQIIAGAVDAGKGLCIALDEIHTLDGSLTQEEAGRLTSDLSTIIRSLKRIQTLIKEH